MKKTISRILAVAMSCLLICMFALPTFASDVAPCYYNCNRCTTSFTVYQGRAYAVVDYDAYQDTFIHAKVTFKIEKQFLGIFWNTVEIDETDNTWVAYNYSVHGTFDKSWPVSGSGTYRGVFTIEIHGKDGTVDVIEDVIKSTT